MSISDVTCELGPGSDVGHRASEGGQRRRKVTKSIKCTWAVATRKILAEILHSLSPSLFSQILPTKQKIYLHSCRPRRETSPAHIHSQIYINQYIYINFIPKGIQTFPGLKILH